MEGRPPRNATVLRPLHTGTYTREKGRGTPGEAQNGGSCLGAYLTSNVTGQQNRESPGHRALKGSSGLVVFTAWGLSCSWLADFSAVSWAMQSREFLHG